MTPNRHGIWSGPIIGYGDTSSMSAGGRFEYLGNFEHDPQAENAKKGSEGQRTQEQKFHNQATPHANSSATGERKTARTKRRYRTEINILEQQLAKAARDKTMRADAAKRLPLSTNLFDMIDSCSFNPHR